MRIFPGFIAGRVVSRVLRAGVTLTLVGILATLPTLASLAEAQELRTPVRNLDRAETFEQSDDDFPFLEAIKNTTLEDLQKLHRLTPESDPVRDEDPFFLRAQSWKQTGPLEADLSFQASNSGVRIQVGVKQWLLDAPLTPRARHGNWILFSSDSRVFLEKFGSLEETGLFYTSVAGLRAAAEQETRVPVFFLPMVGDWTNEIEILSVSEDHALVQNAEGDATVVSQKDLAQLNILHGFNYSLALISAASSIETQKRCSLDEAFLRCLQEDLGLLPLTKSTSFFGTRYEGLPPKPNFFEKIWRSFSRDFLIGSAFAETNEVNPEDAALIRRLIHVGAILGTALVISIALKHTVFRDHFKKQRTRRAEENPDRREGRVRRELRETLDIYAHSLLFINQVGLNLPTDFMEKAIDRFAPRWGAGQKSFLRKFLDSTFYFARRTNQGVPVNANTWVQGSIVLGGIDTTLVFLQLKVLMPEMGYLMGRFSDFIGERAEKVYAPGADGTANYFRNELVRNAAMYLANGAVGFSQDTRSQIQLRAEKEVDDELRAAGLNPLDSANEGERTRRIEEKFRREAVRRGLPSEEDFAFDLTSVIGKLETSVGVSLGKQGSKFLLEGRSGLFIPSVNLALKELKNSLAEETSVEERVEIEAAIQILESAVANTKDITGIKGAMRDAIRAAGSPETSEWTNVAEPLHRILSPAEWKSHITRVRETRKMFLKLSYAGKVDPSIENLPTEWTKGFGEKPAILAARAFRGAVTSLYYGVPFTREMIEGGYELELDPLDYVHRDSKFARHQLDVIRNRAELRFEAVTGRRLVIAGISDSDRSIWYDLYTEEFSKMVGLYRDYDFNPTLEETVKTATQKRFDATAQNSDYQKYLNNLGEDDRFMRLSRDYAELEISTYVETTVELQAVPALSPAQPGLFQKFRQNHRQMGKWATGSLRAIEALFSEHNHKLGFNNVLGRTIPAYYDISSSLLRFVKKAPSMLTLGFASLTFIWGADFPYAQWVFFAFLWWSIAAPYQFSNRLMTNIGLPPLKSIGYMALFAFVHSMLSWQGSSIQTLFWDDWFHVAWHALGAFSGIGILWSYASYRLEKSRKPASREEREKALQRVSTELSRRQAVRDRVRSQPAGEAEGLSMTPRKSWCGLILGALKKPFVRNRDEDDRHNGNPPPPAAPGSSGHYHPIQW